MTFYTKRRSSPVVPIVSLIDILAILLIFFIATTTFRKNEALLSISLPKANNLTSTAVVQKRITISVTKEEQVWIGEEEIKLSQLGAALKLLKSQNPDLKLELKADEELPLGVLVQVWDGFNQAGIAIKDVPARILLQK